MPLQSIFRKLGRQAVIIVAILCLYANLYSQRNPSDYFQLRLNADSCLRMNNFPCANALYLEAFEIGEYKTITDQFMIGYTHLLLGETRRAIPYLQKSIRNGFGYNDTAQYMTKYRERGVFKIIQSNSRLKRIFKKLELNTISRMRPAIQDSSLFRELLGREKHDQANRTIQTNNDSTWAVQTQYDSDNQKWLKNILETKGWPGFKLVGYQGAKAAWLIAQHSDRDTAFQNLCFKHMKKAYYLNDIDKADFAYLIDRIKVNGNEQQIFGSQCDVDYDDLGKPAITFKPIEDEKNVDVRRKVFGMQDIDSYKAYFLKWLEKK